ncbi:GntP family permease [Amycolatopsis regifaucium]|uniref:Gluconate permease n=1 Tax=Amycolatopsis regifaucium TaxID=546365 RepID=A0A154M9L1_9PSEU|nr:SLC13 family permease [Amycolatopsis regifaucium]KZB81007.1 gluconate permease [Amycolatopsis regifaucium]OKA11364.1 gluconate permease [Amycolatopsis regifaucium]SFH43703.1 H+/gluconate symporter [Amycolatopsis regifaucium]
MSDAWLLAHTGIAIVGIVVLITWLKTPPIFGLVLGATYLGLATGLGASGTTEALATGFGAVLAEIGLLITFGVVIGSLLTATNTLHRVLERLLGIFGERRVPMVFAVTLSTVFTSIYSDVVLVLTAPLARRLGVRLGRRGVALMGGALTAGIEVGLVFVVPGVAALAVAGLLGVPLGEMFLYGLTVGLPTAVLTTLLFALLLRRVLRWNPATDELGAASDPDVVVQPPSVEGRQPPLALSVSPVLVTLSLIALGALANAFRFPLGPVSLLSEPPIAMAIGAGLAFLLARRVLPRPRADAAVGKALAMAGPILVLSGLSGSVAEVIGKSGLRDVLASSFSTGVLPPLVLVWLIAAVLHIAMGSISISAITAAGILAPIAGSLGVPVVLVALAACSGALFLPHVSSNFFWMFQTLLGLSTRGTFKTHTVAMSLASVISLPIVLLLDIAV